MTERVLSDVFPANVTVTTSTGVQTFQKSRIVLTVNSVYVFQDSPTGPELVYNEPMASYDKGVPLHRRTRSTPARQPSATTESGAEITFTRASGCGCGSRLKSFSPFTTINAVASTRDA